MRHSFGADLTAWTLTDDGSHIPLLTADVTITAWSAQTGGTAITDLSLDAAGTVPVDHITSANGIFDPYGTIPLFYGPDSVWSLWLSANGAPRLRIIANDLGDTIGVTVATTAADLATHEAARNPHLTRLDDLTDVAIPTPNDGDIPAWQTSSTSWIPRQVPAVTAVTATKTASFTAVPWNLHPVSITAASVTATLPAAATAGQVVMFYLTAGSVTNTCTISRAGSDTINGALTTFPLVSVGESVTLVSSGGGTWWVVGGRVDSPLHVGRTTAATDALVLMQNGDTVARWNVLASGAMAWGPGSSTTRDTNLFRGAAGVLVCDGLAQNVSGAAETMHGLTPANSWIATGDLANAISYQLVTSPPNSLYIELAIKSGTKTNGTIIATLPAGWRPAHKRLLPVAVDVSAGGTIGTPRISVNTDGTLTIDNCTSAGFIFGADTISLS